MKPWMVWPMLLGIAGVLWATNFGVQECPAGQIFIGKGFGGACVVGTWR